MMSVTNMQKIRHQKEGKHFFTPLSAQSQSTLEDKLEALQCHFTWDLGPSRAKLFRLRDELDDIATEEGYSWLGHIYNLQGYIHCQLGSTNDALRYFSMAAEAFRQMRNTVSDEGPWLVVNYGNMAWLHHHLGKQAECQTYLTKVDTLMNEYPSPSQDELHPEIYAEKAWTLMKFGAVQKRLAADYFQRAIRMQPDMVEWHTSHVIVLVSDFNNRNKDEDILKKMKIAKEHDPENLYLAAIYLEACARKGGNIEAEARELARKILRKPLGPYSGIRPLLRLYTIHLSPDEAIDLAEELLERHPGDRYLKSCAANCYKWKIFSSQDNPLEGSMIDRAISLCKDVISLYPDYSLKTEISLANIYARSNQQDKADQIFNDLLERDLDPAGKQMLYNCYAKHVHFNRKEIYKSIKYHMKAAEIPLESRNRENSIRVLEKIKVRNRNRMCGEIEEFLANLQK